MKKILLIGSELGKGGAERSISLLSYHLAKTYDVTLCILSGKAREKFYKTCEKLVFIDPPAGKPFFVKIKAWWYRIKKLRQLKRNLNVDVSISFLEGPDYSNILTKGNEKVILSIRGSKQFDKEIRGKGGLLRKKVLIPWLYRKADHLVCVSEALSCEMHTYFHIKNEQLSVIYNFYEIDEIEKKSSELLTADENKIFTKPVVINSGRLHPQKEHRKLIEVFKRLRQLEDCRLVILGDGALKKELIDFSVSLDLKVCDWANGQIEDADIYFMGYQSNPFKFYRHSKLFALTSSWEGFPNVLAEALICALPVVSADCPTGPREILDLEIRSWRPVSKVHRIDIGSLMPLLSHTDEKVMNLWTDEIHFWLSYRRPDLPSFKRKINRFSVEEAIKKWEQVIESGGRQTVLGKELFEGKKDFSKTQQGN